MSVPIQPIQPVHLYDKKATTESDHKSLEPIVKKATDDVGSPKQLLMSRLLRSIIPTTEAQLQPKVLDPAKVREKLKLKQEKQKHYFDQHAKHLPTLGRGDQIRVQIGGHWKQGVVTEHDETPRIYRIQ